MLFAKILKLIIKNSLDTDAYDINDINSYDLSVTDVHNIGPMLGSKREILHDRRNSKMLLGALRLLPVTSNDVSTNWIPRTPQLGYKIDELLLWSNKFRNRLETLEFMYTRGIANLLAHHHTDGSMIIDLSLYHIEVRSGYAPYGCYLRYKNDKLVEVRYQDQIYSRDMGFPDHILAMAISTVVLYTTVVLHAGVCHFYYSGDISARERQKSTNVIVTALLKIFTFRNAEINTSAMDLLVSNGGLIERLFAVTHNGLLELLKYTELAAQHIEHYIWTEGQQRSDLQVLFQDFSAATYDFLTALGVQDEQKVTFVKLITMSTIVHELVGSTIGMYFLSPHILKTKILTREFNEDTTLIESQSSYEINEIAVYFTSGATVPSLLDDALRYCFPVEHRTKLVEYQSLLRCLNDMWEGSQIDLRNLETSISL